MRDTASQRGPKVQTSPKAGRSSRFYCIGHERKAVLERVDYESLVVQELINAHQRDELDITPWYQRRSVWTTAHKSYLINSIFAGMPVPTLYIRHTIDIEREKTVKEVVDGQQRIRSILGFRAAEFSARHPHHDKRVFYKDLSAAQRESFLMTKLPIGYLIGADDADVIEIFGRLNAVSKTLNAQEKRAAKYSGEFHQFCLMEAVDRLPMWRDLNLFTATEISRMAEVQFIADLSMSLIDGMQDFSAARIDRAYAMWDEEFPQRAEVERRIERVLRLMASLDVSTVRDTIASRSPVFYSLVLVLDGVSRLPTRNSLEDLIWEIDARFNDPRPATERPAADVAFVSACTASTQRIRSRRTRFDYIQSFVKK